MGIIFAESHVIQMIEKSNGFDQHLKVAVPNHESVDSRISNHTDLMVFVHDKIYCEPSVFQSVFRQIVKVHGEAWSKQHIICGEGVIGPNYPEDVKYNVLALAQHMFHLLSVTERRIVGEINLQCVNVNQGYTRCSCLPIGKTAIITEDATLGKVVADYGYDVLLIERGHVELKGFPYGLFGGSGGQIDDKIVFNGSLSKHPNHDEIKRFIENRGLSIVELHDEGLIDSGSILYYL